MALSPTNNTTFLQEVDEAVRKDQLNAIVQKWGRWILGFAIVALLAFGGYLYWEHRQSIARGETAEQLITALEKARVQPTAALPDLQRLEKEGSPAYRAMAILEQSNIKAKTGDIKGAAALVARIAQDQKLDQSLRDMALIRQTVLEYDSLKPEVVIARMKPIVEAKDPQSSWFASAAELTATAYYQQGQYDKAGALYGRIAKLPGVTKSLQQRALDMAGMLGVDAVTDGLAANAARDQSGRAAATAKTEEAK